MANDAPGSPPPGEGDVPAPPPDLPPPYPAPPGTPLVTPSGATVRPFRDPSGLATALTVLLGISAVFALVLVGVRADERSLVEQVRDDPASVTLQELQDSDDRVAAFGALFLFGALATSIVFVVWAHRAYSNLPALRNPSLRFGTGWAVGSWLIPFFNLVRPIQIMQDVWRGSDPDAPADDPEWYRRPMSGLLAVWWALWVLGAPLGLFGARDLDDASSIDEVLRVNGFAIASALMAAVTAVVSLVVVRTLTRREVERARRLGVGEPA